MSVNFTAIFLEALMANQGRGILATSLGTEALGKIPDVLRKQVFWSAGVTSADLLEDWYQVITDLVEAKVDRATARMRIRDQVERTGYLAEPGTEGSLLDLSSSKRINLIIDTQQEIINGWGRFEQENDAGVIQAFPARELYRAIDTADQRPWMTKWHDAGGQFFGPYKTRMIARVDDPIWTRSLNQGGFNRFGIPTGPFDFNSGMRTRPVGIREAEELGVIKRGDALPKPQKFELQNSLGRPHMSEAMKAAVRKADIGEFDAEGVLRPAA